MKQIVVNDVRLNVWDAGSGTPILLVHGFPLSHVMWREQLEVLAARHRLIAPDLRGFGASEVTSDATTTMEQFADDCAGLLEALGVSEPITFCGLSMGGYIAWEFVRKYRDRLGRLILCDTRAAADTPEAAANRHKLADGVLANGPEALARAMLPRLLSPATQERRPELAETMLQMMVANPAAGIAAAQRGLASRIDARELLPTIEVPSLLIVGVDDAISPVDEMRGMAEAMPQAGLLVVPEAGHMAPLENPAVVNTAIADFLSD